jgi:hypothetical protein
MVILFFMAAPNNKSFGHKILTNLDIENNYK